MDFAWTISLTHGTVSFFVDFSFFTEQEFRLEVMLHLNEKYGRSILFCIFIFAFCH